MFKHTNKLILGIDVGGTHISSALVNLVDGTVLGNTFCKKKVNTQTASSKSIIDQWLKAVYETMGDIPAGTLDGIGIAMPGPFDYNNGISLINGVNKYQSLFGINIREALKNQLDIASKTPVIFENDASCFGLGECLVGEAKDYKRIIAITLGTGFGACFIDKKKLLKEEVNISPGGCLYNVPFKNGIAEDYISSRWLLKTYHHLSGESLAEVKEIAERAMLRHDAFAIQVFEEFGKNIGECLSPWITTFCPDCLVIGGSISKSCDLFLPALCQALQEQQLHIPVKISKKMEISAIAGAAGLIAMDNKTTKENTGEDWRKSSQPLLPQRCNEIQKLGGYDIYPYHRLGDGRIISGYDTLADWIAGHKVVMIDGYGGNDWAAIREYLAQRFNQHKKSVLWYETSAFLKPEGEITDMIAPFLGQADSVWGKKAYLSLADFFNMERLKQIPHEPGYDIIILIGTGAALSQWTAPLIYVELPKNEIQYRMRAGSIACLGKVLPEAPVRMYKQFFFVDWVVLNRHRQQVKEKISIVADGQWRDSINWAPVNGITAGLDAISRQAIRPRPWFEAGAWGGQWMKEHIPALNKNEINYAWSFELITPENGIVLESDGHLLELPFDWLMEHNATSIMGRDAGRYGDEFPIRFDFLDTFDGGNLSIQCHPSLSYIQEQFGEKITQDETYYILDCKKDAKVYLGFQDDICPDTFNSVLTESFNRNIAINIDKYVQSHPSNKHDLFLIPNGTIHSAGMNNLVLEISATPYIYTFKMYDWIRPDLNGKPRPINIEHAFNNLHFERKGKRVQEELISKPVVLEDNAQYRLVHLPTHAEHFYDVHRLEFIHDITVQTNDQCHVLMLVEGEALTVETGNGTVQQFNYAETFIIPAAIKSYRLKNEGPGMARVIKAFIK